MTGVGRIVVGSGYIAVEFAGIFNAFGLKTHLVFRADRVLRGFDDDIRNSLTAEMVKKGMQLHATALPDRIEKAGDVFRVHLTDGSMIEADKVMYATGRYPNTAGLGLAEVGVALDHNGAVIVNEWSQTSVASIYAVGDVTNRINLTPVAIAEGHSFAETVFNNRPMQADFRDVPSAVFSQPPVGTVGLTEAEAREQYGAIDVYAAGFRPMKYTLTDNPERGMQKLIVDRASDRVVGAQWSALMRRRSFRDRNSHQGRCDEGGI